MSQDALIRIQKCLDNKDTHLDLGLCGLQTADFLPFAEVRNMLIKCTHLKTLILSNSWYNFLNRPGKPMVLEGYRNQFIMPFHSISELTELTKLICCGDPGFAPIINNLNGIEQFSNLTYLDISNNHITAFQELNNLKKLQFLNIRNSGLKDLADIKDLYDLKELDASNNSIRKIKGLEFMNSLKKLDLGYNVITVLEGLDHLISLETLGLGYNTIAEITSLDKLISLRELYLENNNITTLDGLEGMIRLETLNLSINYIADLRKLAHLPNLTNLKAASNRLRSLSGIEQLKKLQKLDVSNNSLEDITPIRNLTALKKIDLNLNNISNLEPLYPIFERENNPLNFVTELSPGSETGEINVNNNPIKVPDLQIIQQGRKAVLAYFENLKISKLVPFREAKVILLGEPDAGKTNLLNYFLGKPFAVEKSVTRGVNIAKHSFDHKGIQYQINFWDFGGQEVQQSVHQYFLTDNTLYLIVLNAVTDEQPDKYLQFLDNHAQNSPFIIVTNKDDLNGNSKLRNNKIWNDYKGRLISSEIRISLRQAADSGWCNKDKKLYSKRRKQLEELRELVKSNFLKLPHLDQGFLLNYKTVKELVEDIYENEKKPYITMQQFQNYCEDAGIATGTEQSLLSHLNFIGTVRYIDQDNLRGLHILNPEWLSDGIYRIITDNDVKNFKNGKIEKRDIKQILNQTQESKYAYQDNEIDFIITMMCHFRVAYYDDQNKFIYIPNSFPEDLPTGFDKQEFKTGARHYFFNYQTEIPTYIINRFIVKTFKFVKGNVYWNKGILLEDKEHNLNYCEALIEQNDRIIDIWVKGKDIQMFFAIIRESIRNSHEESFTKFEEMIDLGVENYSYKNILMLMYDGDKEFKSTKVIDPITRRLKLYNINEVLGRFETTDEIISHPSSTIKIDMSGGNLIVNGQIESCDTLNQSQPVVQESTESTHSLAMEYKKKKLKAWKNKAWILSIVSLLLTVLIISVYLQDNVDFINAADWGRLKKSTWIDIGGKALLLFWTAFVTKLWYDRIYDKSKQKAYMDSIKLP